MRLFSLRRVTSFASIERGTGLVRESGCVRPPGAAQDRAGVDQRGRQPAGYVTKRRAEAWLRDVLDHARRGSLPGMVRTGATFADAAAEYLRYVEDDRA